MFCSVLLPQGTSRFLFCVSYDELKYLMTGIENVFQWLVMTSKSHYKLLISKTFKSHISPLKRLR